VTYLEICEAARCGADNMWGHEWTAARYTRFTDKQIAVETVAAAWEEMQAESDIARAEAKIHRIRF
jgi:hypothetical protein